MRILHIGGVPAITHSLAQAHGEYGHNVNVLVDGELSTLSLGSTPFARLTIAEPLPEIVHIHFVEPELEDRNHPFWVEIASLRERGVRVVGNSSGYTLMNSPSAPLESISMHLDHLFVTTPSERESCRGFPSWSWLPYPVTHGNLKSASRSDPPFKILFLSERGDSELDATVLPILEHMQKIRTDLKWEVVPAPSIDTMLTLRGLLKQATVVIENLDEKPTSLLCFEALSAGATVLRPLSRASDPEFQALDFCPILSASAQTLQRRLVSLLLEPRAFRDLEARGRKYIEDYHDVKTVGAILLETYRSLLRAE